MWQFVGLCVVIKQVGQIYLYSSKLNHDPKIGYLKLHTYIHIYIHSHIE